MELATLSSSQSIGNGCLRRFFGHRHYRAGPRPARVRLAFHFGFFRSNDTARLALGSTIAGYISSFDHWGNGSAGYVGINMIRSAQPDGECYRSNPSKGKTLMMLCVAASLDAMAVGPGMAMIGTR